MAITLPWSRLQATYTLQRWGEPKAREYIADFHSALSRFVDQPGLWRSTEISDLGKVNYMRTGRQVVFFVPLRKGGIGIAAVYH